MSNCNCFNKMLRIPYGNDFRIGICRSNVAPGSPDNITFADVENLTLHIISTLGVRTEMQYTIPENGDILFVVPVSVQRKTGYSIEMTGTYQGHPWRWKAKNVFCIVDSNCDSSVQPDETFGMETYYLDDDLIVETNLDTMTITTHGHASLTNGTLMIQSTEHTTVSVEGKTLTITYNDR